LYNSNHIEGVKKRSQKVVTKQAGRKPKKKILTIGLDNDLYAFFVEYAKEERDTMAGIIRRHILELKRGSEQRKREGNDSQE
jgi:hypothetical protein